MAQDAFVEKLLARHAELKAVVDEYNRIISEFMELNNTIDNLRRHFPDDFPAVEQEVSAQHIVLRSPAQHMTTMGQTAALLLKSPIRGGTLLTGFELPKPLTISGLAEEILAADHPLHATEILKRLREKGWQGSGDDQKDIRNVSTTLGLKKDVFYNNGRNTWSLKSQVEPTQEVTQE